MVANSTAYLYTRILVSLKIDIWFPKNFKKDSLLKFVVCEQLASNLLFIRLKQTLLYRLIASTNFILVFDRVVLRPMILIYYTPIYLQLYFASHAYTCYSNPVTLGIDTPSTRFAGIL